MASGKKRTGKHRRAWNWQVAKKEDERQREKAGRKGNVDVESERKKQGDGGLYVKLTKENGYRMGGGEAWRGRHPCISRGGKAEVNSIGIEKEEKTRYLGLERGRKEQSRGR